MFLTPRYDEPSFFEFDLPLGDPAVPLLRQRRRLASLLGRLDDEQWAAASRCEGWCLRDRPHRRHQRVLGLPSGPRAGQRPAAGQFDAVTYGGARRRRTIAVTTELLEPSSRRRGHRRRRASATTMAVGARRGAAWKRPARAVYSTRCGTRGPRARHRCCRWAHPGGGARRDHRLPRLRRLVSPASWCRGLHAPGRDRGRATDRTSASSSTSARRWSSAPASLPPTRCASPARPSSWSRRSASV